MSFLSRLLRSDRTTPASRATQQTSIEHSSLLAARSAREQQEALLRSTQAKATLTIEQVEQMQQTLQRNGFADLIAESMRARRAS